jgi:hypothetical protein
MSVGGIARAVRRAAVGGVAVGRLSLELGALGSCLPARSALCVPGVAGAQSP